MRSLIRCSVFMFALVMPMVAFAQEPVVQAPADPVQPQLTVDGELKPMPGKLTPDEQSTFDLARVQQVQAEAAVMKTAAYRDYVKAQAELQKVQQAAQAKQQTMLQALQATPEYKAMMVLRQNLEQRIKARGEKNVIDWATGTLKPAPPAARR